MSKAGLKMLLKKNPLRVPPLEIHVQTNHQDTSVDAIVKVAWRERSCDFSAILKTNSKPVTLKLAIDQLREYARASEQRRPMLIAPYFSQEKLDQLLGAGISAIDLSGNAAIDAPGELFFYKTGNPNLYPDSSSIRSAYRGDGSLVARVLLLEREFRAISEIKKSIRARGGALTLGMVSKVLQRLEEDLVIERPNRNTVKVIQPDRLLDGLLDAYQPLRTQTVWTGRVDLSDNELLNRLQTIADGGIIRTGESSAGAYSVWAGEPIIACYCRETPTTLLDCLTTDFKETPAFANLRLIQTIDQRVYFDVRENLCASPIQAWLEMASGDKRQKEAAEPIRKLIVRETGGSQ